ncbi:MAG: glycosyltransferase family 1 protein [Bryobacteraceae bacterium]
MKTASCTIALDSTYSVGRNLSGVGVYSREIANELALAHPEAKFLFCYRPHRFLRSFEIAQPGNAGRRLLWNGSPRSLDLFHGLNQRLDRRYRRAVSTFHDLFVLTSDYSTPEFRARFAEQARLAAERSDLIVAVSEFTASQVCDLLKVERSRIRVVPHGVRIPQEVPTLAREPMILFVGAIQKRKNVQRLVSAFESTPGAWKLVLAGSMGYGAAEILQQVERSSRKSDMTIAGYVDDQELERLYGRASIFAFPSLDEGFGIPVLEAMARGVPVLSSNCSALKEVAGEAALLVDPKNTEEIAAGLNRLIKEEDFRKELSRKGLKHVPGYTWNAAASRTWEVYRELLAAR